MIIRKIVSSTAQAERKALYKKEIEDEQLVKSYKEIDKRFGAKIFATTSFPTTRSVLQQFHAVKEGRRFDTYNDTQRYLNRYYSKMNLTIGRKPTESLISRSIAFREKVEKASQSSVSILDGAQNWCLSLRESKAASKRDSLIPIGTSHNGLWTHIISINNKQIVTIRKPDYFTEGTRTLNDSFDSNKGSITQLIVSIRINE